MQFGKGTNIFVLASDFDNEVPYLHLPRKRPALFPLRDPNLPLFHKLNSVVAGHALALPLLDSDDEKVFVTSPFVLEQP